jgi:hypothetical protein
LPKTKRSAEKHRLPWHHGDHIDDYFDCVRSLLERLEDEYKSRIVNDCNLCGKVSSIMEKLRTALEKHEIWLKDEDPNKKPPWKCPSYS